MALLYFKTMNLSPIPVKLDKDRCWSHRQFRRWSKEVSLQGCTADVRCFADQSGGCPSPRTYFRETTKSKINENLPCERSITPKSLKFKEFGSVNECQ